MKFVMDSYHFLMMAIYINNYYDQMDPILYGTTISFYQFTLALIIIPTSITFHHFKKLRMGQKVTIDVWRMFSRYSEYYYTWSHTYSDDLILWARLIVPCYVILISFKQGHFIFIIQIVINLLFVLALYNETRNFVLRHKMYKSQIKES